ncbi:MAG: hypothetical protein V1930_07705 [Pseudomonadota bacterium]
MDGKAILMEDPIKGVIKEVKVVITSVDVFETGLSPSISVLESLLIFEP